MMRKRTHRVVTDAGTRGENSSGDALPVGVEAVQMRTARCQEDRRTNLVIGLAIEPYRQGADLRHVDVQIRIGAEMLDVRDLAFPMTNFKIGLDMLGPDADGVGLQRLRFRALHEVHLWRADETRDE